MSFINFLSLATDKTNRVSKNPSARLITCVSLSPLNMRGLPTLRPFVHWRRKIRIASANFFADLWPENFAGKSQDCWYDSKRSAQFLCNIYLTGKQKFARASVKIVLRKKLQIYVASDRGKTSEIFAPLESFVNWWRFWYGRILIQLSISIKNDTGKKFKSVIFFLLTFCFFFANDNWKRMSKNLCNIFSPLSMFSLNVCLFFSKQKTLELDQIIIIASEQSVLFFVVWFWHW